MRLSTAEQDYLRDGPPLGRLATVDKEGRPHNVPVGYRYNETTGTVDVHGRDLPRTRKFRNARRNPHVCIVVDDVLPPWRPRGVMIRGRATAIDHDPASPGHAVIRIAPAKVASWGLEQ